MNYPLRAGRLINSEHMGKTLQIELPLGKNQSAISFKIHYVEEGTGEPLVLVHSAGQSLYTWNGIVNELSQQFRVIAVDLVGHGYSDKSSYCTYSVDEQAMILSMFLNKLGIKSADFVGFSLGCAVIASLAASNPARAGKIVLMSPGGITHEMPTVVRMMESRILGGIATMFLSPSMVRSILTECFLDLTTISEEMISQYAEPLMDGETRRATRMLVASFYEGETLKALSQLTSPVHILIAADDKWRSSESVQPFFDVLKNGTSAVIRNAGHLMHEEKPEKVIAAIKAFINPEQAYSAENDGDNKAEDTDRK